MRSPTSRELRYLLLLNRLSRDQAPPEWVDQLLYHPHDDLFARDEPRTDTHHNDDNICTMHYASHSIYNDSFVISLATLIVYMKMGTLSQQHVSYHLLVH